MVIKLVLCTLSVVFITFMVLTVAEGQNIAIAYEQEIARQEKLIRKQHGEICMLDGILRNEIKKFTLQWVDTECP